MMKKVLLTAGLTLGVAGGGLAVRAGVAHAGSAPAQQNFTVDNETGDTINNLYVSENNDNAWGDDILGEDTLDNGQSVDITFHGYKPSECIFDIKITDTAGDSWILQDANLCVDNTITFHSDKSGNVTYTEE